MTNDPSSETRSSIRHHQLIGLAAAFLLVGGVGGWAATTDISGAVVAPGVLVVESYVKQIQHETGGTVGQIFARDGDKVKFGDVLIRLDDTVTRANLAIVKGRLLELLSRKARLEAERDDKPDITFPHELSQQFEDLDVAKVVAGERRLFKLRKAARVGQKATLEQRVQQLNKEIEGLVAQEIAKAQEIVLIQRELEGARTLWKKNLMPISKITNLERQATRLAGEKGGLTSSIARSKAKVLETELQIIQIDRDLASEVAKELREIETKIAEIVERKIAAEEQLKRIDIVAPQSGTVHQSIAHTVGGVIKPGETVMTIVPNADKLRVEARVAPSDIDQVHVGQKADLRFSSFNRRTTPEISGRITRISADITRDQRTGAGYYLVRLSIDTDEAARLGLKALIPGMPVEVFMKTTDRNVLSYLVKPLRDQIARAFREE
jgi:membrane fusion protein, type I secretion system